MQTVNVGGRDCVRGFDWSWWQDPRDLSQASAGGYEFFIVKATEGNAYRDGRYAEHVANGLSAGLLPGAYHFARPDREHGAPYYDGRLEAESFLRAVDDRIRFCALDLEATEVDAADTTEFVRGWFDEMDDAGRFPARTQRLLYVGAYFSWWHTMTVAGRACLWIPSYTAGYEPDVDPSRIDLPAWSKDLWPEGWCVWQFSSAGTVAGLHPSDVNVATVEWLDAVRSGDHMDHPQPFPQPEATDMGRPIYKFPAGDPNENERYWIDLRSGAYVDDDGHPQYGPHWYHTDDPLEIFALISGRDLNPADTRWLSVDEDDPEHPHGGPKLDQLYGRWPHVYRTESA